MKPTLKNIKRLKNVIDKSLYTITGKLPYSRITDAITGLANLVTEYPDDSEDIWFMEDNYCGIASLIVGAYWHYTDWHAGQRSPEYAALSALGQVFNPGMSLPEDDNDAYRALNSLAES
jgi:hypothetical protein